MQYSLLILFLFTQISLAETVTLGVRQVFENTDEGTSLTDLGTLDWHLYDEDSGTGILVPTNAKDGGGLITQVQTIGNVEEDPGFENSRVTYSYTDGTEPTTGDVIRFDRHRLNPRADGDTQDAGISVQVMLPEAGTYRLEVHCVVGGSTNLQATASLTSGVSDDVIGQRLGGIVRFEFFASVETDGPDTLTFEVTRPEASGTQFGLGIIALREAPLAERIRIYHVGNSLTEDALPLRVAETLTVNNFAVRQGRHVLENANLTRIVNSPDDGGVMTYEPFGRWPEEFANEEWDAITLQAFIGNTAQEEINATRTLIEAATTNGRNQDCVFYLYHAWPGLSTLATYSDRIGLPFDNLNDQVFLSNAFADLWYQEVAASFPDLDIRLIPTGTVLGDLDQELMEMPTGGFSETHDLYRDSTHLSFHNGRHIALLSMVTALSQTRPTDLLLPTRSLFNVNLQLSDLGQEVVQQTFSNDPRTGFGIIPTLSAIISQRILADRGMAEYTFTGQLYRSEDLVTFERVENVTSPFQISLEDAPKLFFRVEDE